MGGHDGGDVASRIVVEEFARLADDGYDPARGGDLVTETLRSASAGSSEYGAAAHRERQARGYAGTTVAAALLVDDGGPKWLLVNLGDSRIYRVNAATASTRSASTTASCRSWSTPGRSPTRTPPTHPERHVITRALGGPDLAEADYFLLPLAAVERLLLCSDGMSGMIDDAGDRERPRRGRGPA